MLKDDLQLFKQLDSSFTVLYVEDDDELRIATKSMLKIIFPNVIDATDGEDGLLKYKKNHIDLVITDINMPKMDGLHMLKEIKDIDSLVPCIIFTAFNDSKFLLESIKLQVDNYIIKPYTMDELIQILSNNIKKYSAISKLENSHKSISLGKELSYDCFSRKLTNGSEAVKLSKKEDALLKLLLEAKGQVVTYREIEDYLYQDKGASSQTLRALVARLRKKIGYETIDTIAGIGFKVKI